MNAQSTQSLANTEAQQSPSLQNDAERAEASKPLTVEESVNQDDTGSKVEPASPEEGKAGPVLPKKKRKSPEKPWKKPPDMPKRPLSAYNLFFQDEKNRLKAERLKSGKEPTISSPATEEEGEQKKAKSKRKHVAVSGIGFANLAKIVAAKWKSLDAEAKAPYEKIAATDKARYQKEVAVWRAKEKERKAREKEAKNRAILAGHHSRNDPGSFEVPPAPSDQSLASLSALDHPVDWFNTSNERQPQDMAVPPQIQMNARAFGSAQGRISPSHNALGFADHGSFTNPISQSAMSPLGMTSSPLVGPSSYGIHSIHNHPGLPAAGGRMQMPVFSDAQNSYSHNSAPHMGGIPQYSLQPRRIGPHPTGTNPTSPDWGMPMPMQYMQHSSVSQPLQAFPDDPVLLQPEGFAHDAPLQPPPSFASFTGSNPFQEQYSQAMGDISSTQQQPVQLQNSYMPQQQRPLHNPQNQINQPSEFFQEPMMEYITRPRDSRDATGSNLPPFQGNHP